MDASTRKALKQLEHAAANLYAAGGDTPGSIEWKAAGVVESLARVIQYGGTYTPQFSSFVEELVDRAEA